MELLQIVDHRPVCDIILTFPLSRDFSDLGLDEFLVDVVVREAMAIVARLFLADGAELGRERGDGRLELVVPQLPRDDLQGRGVALQLVGQRLPELLVAVLQELQVELRQGVALGALFEPYRLLDVGSEDVRLDLGRRIADFEPLGLRLDPGLEVLQLAAGREHLVLECLGPLERLLPTAPRAPRSEIHCAELKR